MNGTATWVVNFVLGLDLTVVYLILELDCLERVLHPLLSGVSYCDKFHIGEKLTSSMARTLAASVTLFVWRLTRAWGFTGGA